MNISGVIMKKAIGYIRVSTDEQAKEGVSLENQEEKIRSYCDLKDFELLEIVEDAGISAKNLRRPGAQKVIEMAQKKMVDAVVVHSRKPGYEIRYGKILFYSDGCPG
jgi:DNA invertase Pin-like site-specific DNA recombinase